MRKIRVAQHEADVAMSDEPTLPVDHIGMSPRAHHDLRNNVPHETKIDLRNSNAGFAARTTDCDRDVRLGLLSEIDGPMEDAAASRDYESWITGAVGLIIQNVHFKPRD